MKRLSFLLLLLLISCSAPQIEKTEEFEENIVRLVAVGDNLIHSNIYEAALIDDSYDFMPMFAEIKPYIKSFDLAFINQETNLGGVEIGLSSYPCFNSPYEIGDAIIDAGFNLISIANNHILDRGEKAIMNALDYWDRQDLIYSGAARNENTPQIKVFSKNGIAFAFVAYTYGTNGIPHPDGKMYLANVYDNEKAAVDIKGVRDEVDVIIVSMHWGNEYQELPSDNQIEQAHYLVSLGADIILGHHPHVIQPVALIDNTFVVYSLGNFLSGQVGIDRIIGMAFSLDIIKTKQNREVTIKITNPEARLLYHYRDEENFRIRFLSELNDAVLINYLDHFEKKANLIKKYYSNIIIK